MTSSVETAVAAKQTLYDMPVSNNGARCRIILYKKEIPKTDVAIVEPANLGGLKSPDYLQVNPVGKMPAMTCQETGLKLAESDTIARYLLSKYANKGPSFQLDNAKSNLICRMHDMYLTTIQGCMYKPFPPFGAFGSRKPALQEYEKQLHILKDLMSDSGLYLCGPEVSLADATVFPSLVFAHKMLPKFDLALPPKLDEYFHAVKENDAVFLKVHDEIVGAISAWEERGRWDSLLGAGWRDTDTETIFDKIIRKEIPSEVVLEDDHVLAFKDINPAAPAHILVIPKDRAALLRLSKATGEHTEILGRLLLAASEISKNTDLGFGDGSRIVINDGPDAGQEVPHLHVHVLGGRSMRWPPG